jgi:hypothetical protein
MRAVLFTVLLILIGAQAAAALDVVVVNSRDWRDITLGTVYAIHNDANIITFSNLGDAQIKTQTISPNATIVVFESSRPVVRNYASVLRTNGFSDYTVHEHETYRDFQREHFDGSYEALVLLDPMFGTEAISILPLAGHEPMRPFFLDAESRSDVDRAASNAKRIIIAGRFPLRLIEGIEADERYEGLSPDNADQITRMVAESFASEWGVIMRIDRVDFESVLKKQPVVVYSGALSDTIATVRDIGISRFEIVSADAANLGQQIRAGAERDIALMLKYGRTITNLPGMTGQILDLETVFVDYPSPDLTIESAVHYTDANVLLITFTNRGNIDTYSFTNIEYDQNAMTDTHLRVIPPQTQIEVPYPLDEPTEERIAFINARYGMDLPLENTLRSEQGASLVRQEVSTDQSPNSTIEIRDARYNDERGQLYIDVESRGSGYARIEIPYDDELTFTNGPAVVVDGRYTFIIDTPYHRASDFVEEIKVVLYHGENAPVYEQSAQMIVSFERNLLSGQVTAIASGALVFVLVILIVGLILFLKRRRS